MKPEHVSHQQYQTFVLEQFEEHYQGPLLVLRAYDWPIIAKLWLTDLSYLPELIAEQYADVGRPPRDPASIFRSYLLYLMTNPAIGLTAWVHELHRVPMYAILSGFDPQDVPGVGTFYDFFPRLWEAEKKNCRPRKQPKKKRGAKGKKKGEKAPTTKPGRVNRIVDWLTNRPHRDARLPTDTLFDFFQTQIVSVSAELGLLGDMEAMNVAGDGTPIVTASYPRSKRTCNCFEEGIRNCNHHRIYSQPDCDCGWDSSRERYYNGYSLYMLCASDSPHDLPLYPKLQPASRHDSVSLVISSHEFHQRWELGSIDKMLLDAAHDAQAIYEMLAQHEVEPFIDLNERTKKNKPAHGGISISPDGTPICPAGLPMKPNGYDKRQDRQKWRCPCACGTKNTCSKPCSAAQYGRTFHTYPKCDLRLNPKTRRGSKEWLLVYKRRTSVERSNKREKVDYKLECGRHRSSMMWYMRTYGIMICQHVDAWYAKLQGTLDGLRSTLLPVAA